MHDIPWKPILWLVLYAIVAYAYPPLRPTNVLHSIATFAAALHTDSAGG